MSGAFAVIKGGGRLGQAGQFGQVTQHDVAQELNSRGYVIHTVVHEPHVPHVPTVELTKSMAIKVAVDEAISRLGLPRTSTHYYRCPTWGPAAPGCPIAEGTWNTIINWCVDVANGYLMGTYGLPGWAQTALHSGALHGATLGGIGAIGDWLRENPWFVSTVGDAISNYGEYLTAQQVKDTIEANAPKGVLTKEDIPQLLAMLQQGGYIPQGKEGEVDRGAREAAAAPGWLMPVVIGGVALVFLLFLKK